jgi:Polyketide cyclase / dehydrase and lipid transport
VAKKPIPLPSGKEIRFSLTTNMDAPPEAVYDTLADIPTHLEWGGKRVKKNFRLTGIEGGSSAAALGDEWSSTGSAPDGSFRDRSVVTEASRPRSFEFRTESHVAFKSGAEAEWTTVNRYDIEPRGAGSKVTYSQRMTRATDLGGAKMLLNPIVGPFARMMIGGLVKPAMKNLGAMAAERGSRSA